MKGQEDYIKLLLLFYRFNVYKPSLSSQDGIGLFFLGVGSVGGSTSYLPLLCTAAGLLLSFLDATGAAGIGNGMLVSFLDATGATSGICN